MPLAMIGLAVQTGVAALAVFLLLDGSWLRATTGLQLSLPARVLAIAVVVMLLVGTYDEITTYLSNQRHQPPGTG